MWLNVDVPMQRVPAANWLLIAATVVFSVIGFRYDPPTRPIDPRLPDDERLREIVRRIQERQDAITPLALHPQNLRPWQFVTHILVHVDWFHLIGNMIFLFCFGNAVNAKLGHWQFLVVYFGLGVMAGLIQFLALWGDPRPALGASGAISGIAGIYLILYPANEIAIWDLDWLLISRGEPLRLPSWVFLILHFAFDLYGSVFRRQDGIGYVCHLAGEVLGAGTTIGLVYAGYITADRGEWTLLDLLGFGAESKKKKKR